MKVLPKYCPFPGESVGITHPKLEELLHGDFSEFNSVANQLEGYDACYACMGVSSAGMNEADYTRLTYDFTLALAKVLLDLNPKLTFIYVSGQGTRSDEKGSMWARVKGKTENEFIEAWFYASVHVPSRYDYPGKRGFSQQ